ncbi:LPXTG cell wall anchor domain-containing protein [Vibrio sp. R78045]
MTDLEREEAQKRMSEMANIVDVPTLIWIGLCGLLVAGFLYLLAKKQ